MKLSKLPNDLNATVTCTEELEVAVVELDEQWSYVEKKIISNGLFFILEQGKFGYYMFRTTDNHVTIYYKLDLGTKEESISKYIVGLFTIEDSKII